MEKESKNNFDIIIVGTSPLAIAEAVYHKVQGKKVLNIDQYERIGGAWTTINYENLPEIEIGCHIWEIQKETTRFLEDFYQLSLKPLTPQPRILKKSLSIPYDWKVNLSTTQLIAKRIIQLKFGLLRHELKSPHNRFTLFPRKYLYPIEGAKLLKKAVQAKIEEHKLEIQLGTTISEVKIHENRFTEVVLNDGTSLKTQQLVATSVSEIGTVTIGNEVLRSEEPKRMDYIHVHLLIKGGKKKTFSYLRLMDDALIHRVSNMTSQVADQLEKDQQLICVGIHEKRFYQLEEEEIKSETVKTLVERGLFTSEIEVLAWNKNVFPTYYGHRTMLESVAKRCPEQLVVLHSSNFIYAFFNQLAKYKTLLSTSGK